MFSKSNIYNPILSYDLIQLEGRCSFQFLLYSTPKVSFVLVFYSTTFKFSSSAFVPFRSGVDTSWSVTPFCSIISLIRLELQSSQITDVQAITLPTGLLVIFHRLWCSILARGFSSTWIAYLHPRRCFSRNFYRIGTMLYRLRMSSFVACYATEPMQYLRFHDRSCFLKFTSIENHTGR